MKGVILSGGKGSRLAPITDNYPKQLVPILGKPILLHSIEYLEAAGVNDIAIIVSPETGHMIESELKSYILNTKVSFIYQDEPRGLAHAIALAENFTHGDDFIVLLGDNLFDKKVIDLVQRFQNSQADTLILLKDVAQPFNFGVVKFDEQGRATQLVEKPKFFVSNYAIVGVYIFNNKIFKAIQEIKPSARGEYEITDAIAKQVEKKELVQTSVLESYWFDTGTRDGLLDANCRMLLSAKQTTSSQMNVRHSHLIGKINSGEASIAQNSVIMGPVQIGKNVKIINSTIGPYTSISDNVVIENSEIQNSIIMENSQVISSQIIASVLAANSYLSKEEIRLKELIRSKQSTPQLAPTMQNRPASSIIF